MSQKALDKERAARCASKAFAIGQFTIFPAFVAEAPHQQRLVLGSASESKARHPSDRRPPGLGNDPVIDGIEYRQLHASLGYAPQARVPFAIDMLERLADMAARATRAAGLRRRRYAVDHPADA